MFYTKYKEITREFNFSASLKKSDLPGYINHYILSDEQIIAAYKTLRDHGVFTDRKIVLFDNYSQQKIRKTIFTIFYSSITTISVTFEVDKAKIDILLDNGYPVHLNFIDVKPEDKVRLRLLYTCISRVIEGKEPLKENIKRIWNDEVNFK